MNNKLSLKQSKWLKAYVETGNATEAARRAGYNCKKEQSFRQIGYENLTKLDISELLEEVGIADINLAQILSDGLKNSVKFINIINEEGKSNLISIPDHLTRLKYLELALKLKGYLKTVETNKQMSAQDMSINFISSSKPSIQHKEI